MTRICLTPLFEHLFKISEIDGRKADDKGKLDAIIAYLRSDESDGFEEIVKDYIKGAQKFAKNK